MAIDTRVFPLRLQRALYAKLKAISEADRRSMNQWVVVAIEKEIAKYEASKVINHDKN